MSELNIKKKKYITILFDCRYTIEQFVCINMQKFLPNKLKVKFL